MSSPCWPGAASPAFPLGKMRRIPPSTTRGLNSRMTAPGSGKSWDSSAQLHHELVGLALQPIHDSIHGDARCAQPVRIVLANERDISAVQLYRNRAASLTLDAINHFHIVPSHLKGSL